MTDSNSYIPPTEGVKMMVLAWLKHSAQSRGLDFNIEEESETFDRYIAHIEATALREAAESEDFTFETFQTEDGNPSIREHGLTPKQVLYRRADEIENIA